LFKIKNLFVRFFGSKESKERLNALQDSLELFKKSAKGRRYNIDLSSYLREFSKKNNEKSTRSDAYSIYLYYNEYGSGYGPGKLRAVYADAIYSFVLFKDKDPICNIGFNLEDDNDSILVKQIQGVYRKQKELSPLRWEKMLLQIVIDWAKQNKLKKVRVIRSEDSGWYRESNKERCERMYMKYDVTARRMGFKFDESEQAYSLSL